MLYSQIERVWIEDDPLPLHRQEQQSDEQNDFEIPPEPLSQPHPTKFNRTMIYIVSILKLEKLRLLNWETLQKQHDSAKAIDSAS